MARFELSSLNELNSVAQEFVKDFPDPRVFLLKGEMGVGKTTFITSICKALGVQDEVSSPTFSLVNEYTIPEGRIFHFDCYRLNSAEEALDFGIEEYFDSGSWCFVEWPEMVEEYLPQNAMEISISLDGENRVISW